jgi:hypothetical protein
MRVAALLALVLVAAPLGAQGTLAGLRPAPNIVVHRSRLFADSVTSSGVTRGLEVGAGVGAGFYFMLFLLYGRGESVLQPKPFLVITGVFALIGGLVGAIASGN